MKMKEQSVKWMPILALYAAAVFAIAEGYFWLGIVLIIAGSCFLSSAAAGRKKIDDGE